MLSSLSVVAFFALSCTSAAKAVDISEAAKTINLPLTLVHGLGGQGPVYLANISVGTPPQPMTVQVDTGSSALWIFSDQVQCNDDLGCSGGRFNLNASSTAIDDLPGSFNFSYGSGASGTGDWIKDDVTLGDVTVKGYRLGLAKNITGTEPLWPIWGLGPSGDEDSDSDFPDLITELASQGSIDTPAFSLYLNDVHGEGSLLLGGIDNAKYNGDIAYLDVIPEGTDNSYIQWYLNLTAVGVTASNTTTWYSNSSVSGKAAFVDSGSPKAFLPGGTSIGIITSLGGQYNSSLQESIIACSAAYSAEALSTTVDFLLGGEGGVTVRVPLAELVDPYPYDDPPTINGEPACSLGVSPGPDYFLVLGDAFLRGAYAVFDQKAKTVGLASVKYNETTTDIQPITA